MTAVVARSYQHLKWLLALGLAVWFHSSAGAQTTASAAVARIDPVVVRGQLNMDIDLDLVLNETMRQALSRGVPLFFSIELQIEQPRWWWFNKTIVDTTLQRRLSLDTLTRSWRISTGDFSVSAPSYEDALKVLTKVRNWPIVLSDRFEPNVSYSGRVRIRLDTEQLARPLQMDPINRNFWSLSSAWKTFTFSILRQGEAGR